MGTENSWLPNSLSRGRRYEKRIILLKIGCPVILGKLAFSIGYSIVSVRNSIWIHRQDCPEAPGPFTLGYHWCWEIASLLMRENILFLLPSPHLIRGKCFPVNERLDDYLCLTGNDNAAVKVRLHSLSVFFANSAPWGDLRSWVHTPWRGTSTLTPFKATTSKTSCPFPVFHTWLFITTNRPWAH